MPAKRTRSAKPLNLDPGRLDLNVVQKLSQEMFNTALKTQYAPKEMLGACARLIGITLAAHVNKERHDEVLDAVIGDARDTVEEAEAFVAKGGRYAH